MDSPNAEATPVVLIHGFGFGSAVWAPLTTQLPADYTPRLIDLPGHAEPPLHSHPSVYDTLRDYQNAHWVGWSMGGLIALAALENGITTRSLSLLAALPRMVETHDWPCAIERSAFEAFRTRLQADTDDGLRHFTALITHGEPDGAHVRQYLQRITPPNADTLCWELGFLGHSDFREYWAGCDVPRQIVLGAHDALITPEAPACVRALGPDIPITVLEEAGHALPLSQPERCAEVLQSFWNTMP